MIHGRSSPAWIVFLSILLLLASSPILAEPVEVLFHWAPSPAVDDQGVPRSSSVWYVVYLQEDDDPERFVEVVTDTTYVLDVEPGIHHKIRVVGVDALGRRGDWSEYSDDFFLPIELPGTEEPPPIVPALLPNYPNPFNPETIIRYEVPVDLRRGAPVGLEIYNIRGKRVRVLRPERDPGEWEISWNGRDDAGRLQPAGQYVARFVCGDQVQTVKMTMVK